MNMNEQLLARRQQAENTFNELQKQKDQKTAEINEIELEMSRLQGEYRVINSLLEEDTTKPQKVSKKANVIDATQTEGA